MSATWATTGTTATALPLLLTLARETVGTDIAKRGLHRVRLRGTRGPVTRLAAVSASLPGVVGATASIARRIASATRAGTPDTAAPVA